MRLVALVSGGKDSSFCMMHAHALGHRIVALANLKPPGGTGRVAPDGTGASEGVDELDSFMYQTVGHDGIELLHQCVLDGRLPLFRGDILGSSLAQSATYATTSADEVEDLFQLLERVRNAMPEVEGVAVGAILSNYQRVRVEHVCARLGLTCHAYLWRQDQSHLLQAMLDAHLEAILIKVASIGLDGRRHLGASLATMQPLLLQLLERYGSNVCGEGGEYESFTLDCPLFGRRIVLDEVERVVHSDDAFAQVSYLRIRTAHLENKDPAVMVAQQAQLPTLLIPERQLLPNSCLPGATGWPKRRARFLAALEQVRNASASPCLNVPDPGWQAPPAVLNASTNAKVSPSVDISLPQDPLLHWVGPLVTGIRGQGVEACVQESLYTLRAFVALHGLDWSDLLLMHVYVSDMSVFPVLNRTYAAFFEVNPPARVTVQAPLLATGVDGVALQMDCLLRRRQDQVKRETLHVQSISYWAPANIGPYSQATISGPLLCMAGQIGLIPERMELPRDAHFPAGVEGECRAEREMCQVLAEAHLSLAHVDAVLAALGSGAAELLACTCYITSPAYLPMVQDLWAEHRASPGTLAPPLPCSYVIVPALPKGARVEWHVVGVDGAGVLAARQQRHLLSPEGEDEDQSGDSADVVDAKTREGTLPVLLAAEDGEQHAIGTCHWTATTLLGQGALQVRAEVEPAHTQTLIPNVARSLITRILEGALAEALRACAPQMATGTPDPRPRRLVSLRLFYPCSLPRPWLEGVVRSSALLHAHGCTPALVPVDALDTPTTLALAVGLVE